MLKNDIAKFIKSLMSRKFLLTFLGGMALLSNQQYSEFVVLLLGYLGIEGGADIVQRYKGRTLTAEYIQKAVSQNNGEEVNTSVVVTGKPTPLFDETPTTE